MLEVNITNALVVKRERLGVNNILPVASCLSGNVIKTVYENNWMKPRDMSLVWHHTISLEVGLLAHKGRQIQSHWLEAVMDHICCFHFFPGSCCGNHRCCCTLSVGVYALSCLFFLSKLSLVRCTRTPPWMGLKNVFLMFGRWYRGFWEKMCE